RRGDARRAQPAPDSDQRARQSGEGRGGAGDPVRQRHVRPAGDAWPAARRSVPLMADVTLGGVRALAEASQVAQHEIIAQVLKEAQPYIEALRGKTLVIKLGGSALENQRDALEDIIWLHGLGVQPVLVHGGGAEINEWLERLDIPIVFVRGLRVTDAATLEVVRMTLAGKVNGELVRLIGELGGRAIGLTGVDGGLLRVRQIDPELGYVGAVESVDPGPIAALSAAGYIPVIAPLGLSAEGAVFNINGDDAAADLA